jgi:hypothetical protein
VYEPIDGELAAETVKVIEVDDPLNEAVDFETLFKYKV